MRLFVLCDMPCLGRGWWLWYNFLTIMTELRLCRSRGGQRRGVRYFFWQKVFWRVLLLREDVFHVLFWAVEGLDWGACLQGRSLIFGEERKGRRGVWWCRIVVLRQRFVGNLLLSRQEIIRWCLHLYWCDHDLVCRVVWSWWGRHPISLRHSFYSSMRGRS